VRGASLLCQKSRISIRFSFLFETALVVTTERHIARYRMGTDVRRRTEDEDGNDVAVIHHVDEERRDDPRDNVGRG